MSRMPAARSPLGLPSAAAGGVRSKGVPRALELTRGRSIFMYKAPCIYVSRALYILL